MQFSNIETLAGNIKSCNLELNPECVKYRLLTTTKYGLLIFDTDKFKA